MADAELLDYEELAQKSYATHRRKMFKSLLAAVIFTLALASLVGALVVIASSLSVFILVFVSLYAVLIALCSIGSIFAAGCQYVQMHSEPQLLKSVVEYQKLSEEFGEYQARSREKAMHGDYLFVEYMYLLHFIRNRSPEILVEFAA